MRNSVRGTAKRAVTIFSEYVAENKLWYVLVAAAVVFGAVFGAMSAAAMSGERRESLVEYTDKAVSAFGIQPINRTGVFRTSAYGSLRQILLIFISSMGVGMIPLAVLNMGFRGYGIGFTAAFLVQAYRGKGILLAALSLMPRAVILIPAAIVYTVFCIRYAISRRNERNGAVSVRRAGYARSAICLIMATAVFALGSLVEGFVVPTVLKPICSLINIG